MQEDILNTPASKLKVTQLREELNARGLSPAGLKKDLVARLEAARAAASPLLMSASKSSSKSAASTKSKSKGKKEEEDEDEEEEKEEEDKEEEHEVKPTLNERLQKEAAAVNEAAAETPVLTRSTRRTAASKLSTNSNTPRARSPLARKAAGGTRKSQLGDSETSIEQPETEKVQEKVEEVEEKIEEKVEEKEETKKPLRRKRGMDNQAENNGQEVESESENGGPRKSARISSGAAEVEETPVIKKSSPRQKAAVAEAKSEPEPPVVKRTSPRQKAATEEAAESEASVEKKSSPLQKAYVPAVVERRTSPKKKAASVESPDLKAEPQEDKRSSPRQKAQVVVEELPVEKKSSSSPPRKSASVVPANEEFKLPPSSTTTTSEVEKKRSVEEEQVDYEVEGHLEASRKNNEHGEIKRKSPIKENIKPTPSGPKENLNINTTTKNNNTPAPVPSAKKTTPLKSSPIAASRWLHVKNFVRPFTLNAARSMLEGFGQLDFFWMDSIKSQCFVQFSSLEQAKNFESEMLGVVWPKDSGKALYIEFISESVAREKIALLTGGNTTPVSATTAPAKSPLSATPVVKEEPPIPIEPIGKVVDLDTLFKRTRTLPMLYWKENENIN